MPLLYFSAAFCWPLADGVTTTIAAAGSIVRFVVVLVVLVVRG